MREDKIKRLRFQRLLAVFVAIGLVQAFVIGGLSAHIVLIGHALVWIAWVVDLSGRIYEARALDEDRRS